MKYYLDVFTPPTWSAFTAAGASVTGFSRTMGRRAEAIEPGDRFACYLKGKIGWVGMLEATSKASTSSDELWGTDRFPVRVGVRPLVSLPVEHYLPMQMLEGKLTYYPSPMPPKMFSAYLQGSPRPMKPEDGDAIFRALRAHEDGVRALIVEADDAAVTGGPALVERGHSEIQGVLAAWGARTGCHIWLPRNDRGRVVPFLGAPERTALLTELPLLFGGRAQSIVENIDVIWLQGNSVVAAFEVEHSTSIYSGLLRMSDLVASIPNIKISLYIVAAESRRAAVRAELGRPTFRALPTPLATVCGYIPYEKLTAEYEQLGHRLHNFRPEGIKDIAEFFDGAA